MRAPLGPILVVFLATIAGVAFSAVAQPPADPVMDFQPASHRTRFVPESDPLDVDLLLRFSCSVPEAGARDPMAVSFRVLEPPATATHGLSLPAAQVLPLDPGQCTDASYRHSLTSHLTLTFLQSTAAFEPVRVVIGSNLTIQPVGLPAKRYDAPNITLDLEADYAPVIEYHPERQTALAHPGESVEFRVLVESRSNGASLVDLSTRIGLEATASVPPRIALTSPIDEPQGSRLAFSLWVTLPPELQLSNGTSSIPVQLTLRTSSADPRGQLTDTQSLDFAVYLAASKVEFSLGGKPLQNAFLALLVIAASLLLAFFVRERRRRRRAEEDK